MSDPVTRLNAALEGRYRIERELGEGGMATVYLADDLKHERKVAVKVLKPELAAVVGAERFLAEIKTTANLQHPNILPLFDSGEADGFLFYVMPYVEGESLRQKLDREKQLPVDEAVRIATDVAEALHAAHEQGVIHRDIKPANILLSRGRPLVADFGIALAVSAAGAGRLTETGLSIGTPYYMSPEQASADRDPSAASDVYSLGCVLYEILVGEPPYTGPSAQAVLAKILTGDPPAPTQARSTIPPNVDAAIKTALAKLPADRFASAQAFAGALADSSFRLPSSNERAAERVMPAWVPWLTAAVGLAAGLLVGRLPAPAPESSSVTSLVRLTHTGQVGCAAISPDGRQFASIVGPFTEQTDCNGELLLRTVPNGAPLVLAQGLERVSRIRWSPDGSAVLLSGRADNDQEGLFLVPTTGGAVRMIATASRVFGFKTPDTVFVVPPLEEQVTMLDARSGEVLDVRSTPGPLTDLRWSTERSAYVFVTSAERTVGIANADLRVLDSFADDVLAVSWAGPDQIVYSSGSDYSPTVMKIVGVSRSGFSGEPRVVRGNLAAVPAISATSDGRHVLFVVYQLTDVVTGTDLGARGSPAARPIARSLGTYIGDPTISPDGASVVYFRNDAVGFNAYLRPFTGGTEKNLTADSGQSLLQVDWHGGTARLVLSGPGIPTMRTVDLATGRVRTVDLPATSRTYVGAVDGGGLLWSLGEEFTRLDSLGAVVQSYSRPPEPMGHSIIHPDGHTLYGTVFPSQDLDTATLRRLDLATGVWTDDGPIRGLSGRDHRLLTVDEDGFLYYAQAAHETTIWRYRPGDLEPILYATLAFECYLPSVSMTPRADRFVCNVTTQDPDAWLLEFAG